MNFQELLPKLQGRCSHSRKIGNNTYLKRRGNAIALVLHSTDVATFQPNGDIILNSGGYHTHTTKNRINQALSGTSYHLRQKNYIWTIQNEFNAKLFFDGIIIKGGK